MDSFADLRYDQMICCVLWRGPEELIAKMVSVQDEQKNKKKKEKEDT